jgi:phosphoglycolate phosphatase-like HAD superfamily hydrolase
MKKILCLDFDGVICDSQAECLLVSYNAYNIFKKSSFESINSIKQIPEQVSIGFFKYRYLVRPASEYWQLMYLLIDNNIIMTQENFDTLVHKNESILIEFEPFFFSERNRLIRNYTELWYNLHSPFHEFINYMDKLINQYELFIVTNKDQFSVSALLEYFNIPISRNRIWGKEKNSSKINKIEIIAKFENTSKDHIIFIDDHPDYVDLMLKSGIESFLATWGYNQSKHKHSISDFEFLLSN